jgi:hypothetical protein
VPFYTWASVIVDGRVVATDYAPDTGWLVATGGSRPGGTYRLGDPFPEFSMTVPEGWTTSSTSMSSRFGNAGELRRVACGDVAAHAEGEAYDADCARVSFEVVDDPEQLCDDTIEPALGSSFDDLATYMAGLSTTVKSEDVTVDGYRGKRLVYRYDEVGCAYGGYEVADVWLLDVDGVRLMIRSYVGGALDLDVPRSAVRAEIRQMVASIHFER